jgi:hypothetical protein
MSSEPDDPMSLIGVGVSLETGNRNLIKAPTHS